jgi:hypothetical protein
LWQLPSPEAIDCGQKIALEEKEETPAKMRTCFHGWRYPRRGLHWRNVIHGLTRIWYWFLVNLLYFLKRGERRRELERDLDLIRKIR